jgi:hypothetical protein
VEEIEEEEEGNDKDEMVGEEEEGGDEDVTEEG